MMDTHDTYENILVEGVGMKITPIATELIRAVHRSYVQVYNQEEFGKAVHHAFQIAKASFSKRGAEIDYTLEGRTITTNDEPPYFIMEEHYDSNNKSFELAVDFITVCEHPLEVRGKEFPITEDRVLEIHDMINYALLSGLSNVSANEVTMIRKWFAENVLFASRLSIDKDDADGSSFSLRFSEDGFVYGEVRFTFVGLVYP